MIRPKSKNTVIHVPSTIAGTIAGAAMTLIVIEAPSIDAAGSASANIEAQDKDRTVNVGHHLGTLNIDVALRNVINNGTLEFCVMKVERTNATPAIGTHPVPATATVTSVGLQQACRLANPGKVFHYSQRAYVIEQPITKKIIVSPAKFKLSKVKAGDYWILLMYNRGGQQVTYDYQSRYKEYE